MMLFWRSRVDEGEERRLKKSSIDGGTGDLLGIVVQPHDLHVVNVGSIPTGPTHGQGRLHAHTGGVLKSTPNVRKSSRSGLNLEGS